MAVADLQTDDLAADLGRRLRTARYLSGKKVRQLAREVGVSPDRLYRLERGAQIPDALELAAIARLTEQTLDFFLPGTSPDGEGKPVLPPALPLSQTEEVEA